MPQMSHSRHEKRLVSPTNGGRAEINDAGARPIDLAQVLRHYDDHGWARLPRLIDTTTLAALCQRIEQIMRGEIRHDGLFFQHDTSSGRYEDLTYGEGWCGPSLNYRKVEKLERDPLFRAYLEHPVFAAIATTRLGPEVALYRALVMNKAPRGGTVLPWHQDGGKFWGLSRDPELQIWTALDDVPADAGCVEVVPGSHRGGLATPLGGMIPADVVARAAIESKVLALPARAGEVLLIHNYLWHRSGLNRTAHPRRAFTVCYMRADTRCLRTKRQPRTFMPVFVPRPVR